ncbi:hypothetical protein NKR23_g11089 [Pleurostoma richardsiae]|uniref:Uncharacterized protein n=1 Tax=Pleurostoma richardsiae TaxID=41990 RepID=A0AA38R3G1_9PEZI|nr:hypothetical protein NKR23_g11089 [Pleurostoma richardsiae]
MQGGQGGSTDNPSEVSYRQQQDSVSSFLINLPPLLVHEDTKTRHLLEHFVRYVSPVMLMFDDEANGYRYQILPLTHSDPVIRRAVCVTAAFHLSGRVPELRGPAEVGRDAIIRKLRETAPQTTTQLLLDERTWAVILLLVVADLVTGHEHVLVLYRMLALFMHGWARQEEENVESSSKLGKFLYYQSRLITFFACPALGESDAIQCFTHVLHAPLMSFEKYAPRQRQQQYPDLDPVSHHDTSNIAVTCYGPTNEMAFANTMWIFESIMRCALEIYILRARWNGQDPQQSIKDYSDAQSSHIAHLRSLFETMDPAGPGAHIVVWPAFR